MKLEYSRHIFEKYSNNQTSWKSDSWETSCSKRTDRHDKVAVAFCNFANAPKRICKSRHSQCEVRTTVIRWWFSTIFVSLVSWQLCPSCGNVILHLAHIANLCFCMTLRIRSDYSSTGHQNAACDCLEWGRWLVKFPTHDIRVTKLNHPSTESLLEQGDLWWKK